MKKMCSLLLAVLLLAALCACGSADKTPAAQSSADASKLVTMADALAATTGTSMSGMDDEHYVYAFDYAGTPFRVVADLTSEQREEIDAVDFFDEERDEKIAALIGPLPLTSVEDLSVYLPDQAALDSMAGMTGQELLDEGYEPWSYFFEDDGMVYYMVNGLFEYEIKFNETVEYEDDFDEREALKDLTVKSVAFSDLSSSAADLPYED